MSSQFPLCLPAKLRLAVRIRRRSQVLFQLLREQCDEAELVIGLPDDGRNRIAHAWVELDGRDGGPAPGRGTHEPLARFV